MSGQFSEEAKRIAALELDLHVARVTIGEEKSKRDDVYRERNQCVALIARMAVALGYKVGVATDTQEGWDEDWRTVVYIDLPTGQVSWHFHDSEEQLLWGLPAYSGKYDGHTTPQKYDRVNNALVQP